MGWVMAKRAVDGWLIRLMDCVDDVDDLVRIGR